MFGLTANATYDEALRSDCAGRPDRCSPTGIDRVATANDQASVATGLFLGGALVVVGGVVLFLTAPRGPQRTRASSSVLAGSF